VSVPVDPPPISIPPPRSVLLAATLVLVEATGLVVLAVTTVTSGLTSGSPTGQTLAQGGYYLVLAALLALCASALFRGRRWGRTPCLLTQLITIGIGIYLALPSGRPVLGVAVILVAGFTGYLLVNKAATDWINRFPLPFGEAQDR
jgi:hypothetical protein